MIFSIYLPALAGLMVAVLIAFTATDLDQSL